MTQKRYRIQGGARDAVTGPSVEVETPALSGRLDEVMSAIQDLRRMTMASAGETVDACRRELGEAFAMRNELDVMKDAITRTKQEIATLHRSENSGKGMRRVAGELDAVVEATERATTTILGSIEDIETNANMLRAARLPAANQQNVDVIIEKVIVAYEACNFQDLTGQRISKIVGVLKFVEEHLDRMIEAWSSLDSFREMLDAQTPEAIDEERALLNGPKLEEDAGHVDQTDIDALFD